MVHDHLRQPALLQWSKCGELRPWIPSWTLRRPPTTGSSFSTITACCSRSSRYMVLYLRGVRPRIPVIIFSTTVSAHSARPATAISRSIIFMAWITAQAHTECRLTAWITTWTIIQLPRYSKQLRRGTFTLYRSTISQADGSSSRLP